MILVYDAIFIMVCRIVDVSLGTLRTLSVVKGNKYMASLYGFIEVTVWVIAIRHVMLNLDSVWNIAGYSTGFAVGTILGVTIESKFGKGFIQIYVVSMHHAEKIANKLRRSKVGVTLLPGEGTRGGVAIIVIIISFFITHLISP